MNRINELWIETKNAFKVIVGTMICFIPLICYIFLSGQFDGYHPFNVIITKDVMNSGIPFSIIGMAIIILVWGFLKDLTMLLYAKRLIDDTPQKING